MSQNAITVENVSKSFRIYKERNQSLKSAILRRRRSTFEEFFALTGVDLDIPEGETFGLMGHNGSGKSTLLKVIARILEPDTGSVRSTGRMAAMLELGSGFHPELTGRENVYLNGSILGMSRKELDRKFEAITEFAGVGAFIDQPVKSYSSGMYVRLGFSVAIHVEPDILLVDEILAVGDMQFQEKCREKFAEFKDEGRTIVVVSHGLGEMRSLCDQAAWLDHGKVVDVGHAALIVDRYIDAGHDARKVASGGTRHGSGEIQVEKIELLNRHGRDARQFKTGDEVTVRLHWHASQRIERPVFSVSLSSLEGVHIWSHHTWDAEYIPQALDGTGSIDVRIPAIPLQPGTFDVNSSIVDDGLAHSFDQWAKGVRFDVVHGNPRESGGLVAMHSRWGNLQPPTRMDLAKRPTDELLPDLAPVGLTKADDLDPSADLDPVSRSGPGGRPGAGPRPGRPAVTGGAAAPGTAPQRRKVLVLTDDSVGERMAGPAIRAWNIAEVLAADHDVRLASTRKVSGSAETFAVCDGRGERLRDLASGQDIVIVQGFTLRNNPWLATTGAKLVIDLYDPIHLEMLEGGQHASPAEQTFMLSGGLDALRIQIELGDFFLCATERQRDLWLGHMSALGRVNFASYAQDVTLRKLIDVAPFGIPAVPPPVAAGAIKGVLPGIDPGDAVLLWAGGVYNWFDPITLIEAVAALVPELPRLRLVFMGTKHPSVDDLSTVVLARAIDLATELDLLGRHVFFLEGWVPYAERGRYLTDADIGVSTHFLHVETAYSFRTRMLDYLWAGLPIVCSEGDEFAGLVARHGLGAAVPTGDAAALSTALRDLLASPGRLSAAGAAVATLAPNYRWPAVLAPLVAYCADPWSAADGGVDKRPAGRWGSLGAKLDNKIDHLNIYREPAARRRVFTDGRWKVIARRMLGRATAPARRAVRVMLGRRPPGSAG